MSMIINGNRKIIASLSALWFSGKIIDVWSTWYSDVIYQAPAYIAWLRIDKFVLFVNKILQWHFQIDFVLEFVCVSFFFFFFSTKVKRYWIFIFNMSSRGYILNTTYCHNLVYGGVIVKFCKQTKQTYLFSVRTSWIFPLISKDIETELSTYWNSV
jgi:hypothetical protein